MNPRTIEPGTRAYKNLQAVASMLSALSENGRRYRVGDCYFDFGQGWMWTCILKDNPDWGEVQAVCPRDWERIILAETAGDLAEAVEAIRSDEWFTD